MTPAATKTSAIDERQRQQHPQADPGEVHPEIAEPVGVPADQAADQRGDHGHADRGRQEVLHGQPDRLDRVAERGFAGIGLPVGIRHEADRGVEALRGRHVRGAVGQRQPGLDATAAPRAAGSTRR